MATIPATGTVQLTVTSLPRTVAGRKTLVRLMRLNTATQKTLTRVAEFRKRELNRRTRRGGRIWLARANAAKQVKLAVGVTFPVNMRPQLVADVASVEKYVKVG